jgi:small RNA 2'-O-methyltransferase
MEKAALFSHPLSKQRVEFAVRHINELHATTLVISPPNSLVHLWKILFFIAKMHFQVDFGCGSGSLLDSLLEHPTTLEKLVGVDISRKGLTRATKVQSISLTC